MTLFKNTIFVLLTLVASIASFQTYASDRPIIVIRLNQERLYYEDTLRRVMEEAHSIKSNLKVNIKVLDGHEKLGSDVKEHLANIRSIISRVGIPGSSIHTDVATDAHLAATEISVYVD